VPSAPPLQGNPNIAENLSKIQTERSNLQNLLSKTLRELRESSFATLTTTVEEEKARNDMIREVVQKEKEVSAAVKKLQADLATEKQLHVQEVEERNEIIAKLKEDLVRHAARAPGAQRIAKRGVRASGAALLRLRRCRSSALDDGESRRQTADADAGTPSRPTRRARRWRCGQSRRLRPSTCTRWRVRAASRSTAHTTRRRRRWSSRSGTSRRSSRSRRGPTMRPSASSKRSRRALRRTTTTTAARASRVRDACAPWPSSSTLAADGWRLRAAAVAGGRVHWWLLWVAHARDGRGSLAAAHARAHGGEAGWC
jgi:hypothetical protein